MFCEQEMYFLCDTFQKNHVNALVVTPQTFSDAIPQQLSHMGAGPFPTEEQEILGFWAKLEPRTLYKKTDRFKRSYIYLLLPTGGKSAALFVGPYLAAALPPEELLEMGEKNGISPKNQRYLNEYYDSLPVLSEHSQLFTMLDTFCERMWDSPSFAVIDADRGDPPTEPPLPHPAEGDRVNDTLLNMKTLEMRYQFENKLMEAISLGQLHKEKQLLSAVTENPFEKRVADPLRNAKNYDIIMNTLSRKAAEAAGVHPLYLDGLSSSFATKIEQLISIAENPALMREMFRSYCRLVRKHSLAEFSLTVQKTILLIESNLAADLSLNTLAEPQNISPGYLSSLFKKETGKTVSEYIREKRIKQACHLLATTHLQIQTIALHCGIMDLQYFSKVFKKETGMTPRSYRESVKHTPSV